jgi:hypothetical protein
MNKQDQERLLELKLRVYAKVASQLIDPDTDPDDLVDNGTLIEGQIEDHKGRVDKAVRMLKEAGVIENIKIKKDGVQRYKILKFNEAEALGVKPGFDPFWKNRIDDVSSGMYREIDTNEEAVQETLDIVDNTDDNLKDIGYKHFREFSDSEKIYIYYHQDEFDVYTWKNEHYTGKEYYRKDLLTFRHKMILKCLVELELLYNFPQYLQYFSGYDTKVIDSVTETEFEFRKYAISSVFLKNELTEIFSTYEEHNNKANLMREALNKTIAWVKSIGGYKEAIKIIRKQILEDFSNGKKRFELCLEDPNTHQGINREYLTRFKFIESHKDLFNYETLYEDVNLKGDEVVQLSGRHRYWGASELGTVNIKEEFHEPADEGSDLEKQAA